MNTGGKPLDALELVTAMYAVEGHELRKDWYGDGDNKGVIGIFRKPSRSPVRRAASSRQYPTPILLRRFRCFKRATGVAPQRRWESNARNCRPSPATGRRFSICLSANTSGTSRKWRRPSSFSIYLINRRSYPRATGRFVTLAVLFSASGKPMPLVAQ